MNAPVRVVSGFVGRVTVTVPWTSLMSSSCTVMVSGLTITVTPHTTHQTGGQSELAPLYSITHENLPSFFIFSDTMTDSLFFSMGSRLECSTVVLYRRFYHFDCLVAAGS